MTTECQKTVAPRKKVTRRRRTSKCPTAAQQVILRWLTEGEDRTIRVETDFWSCRPHGSGIHPFKRVRRATWQTLKDRGWVTRKSRVSVGATLRFDENQQSVRDKEHFTETWIITTKGRTAAKRGP